MIGKWIEVWIKLLCLKILIYCDIFLSCICKLAQCSFILSVCQVLLEYFNQQIYQLNHYDLKRNK